MLRISRFISSISTPSCVAELDVLDRQVALDRRQAQAEPPGMVADRHQVSQLTAGVAGDHVGHSALGGELQVVVGERREDGGETHGWYFARQMLDSLGAVPL